MRAIFCILFAYYLFTLGIKIKPDRFDTDQRNFMAGTVIFTSWLFAAVGFVLMIFGL